MKRARGAMGFAASLVSACLICASPGAALAAGIGISATVIPLYPDRPGELFENELLSGLVSGSWALSRAAELAFVIGYYDQDFHAQAKPDHSWNQRMLAAWEDSSRLFSQEVRVRSLQEGRWSWMVGAGIGHTFGNITIAAEVMGFNLVKYGQSPVGGNWKNDKSELGLVEYLLTVSYRL